MGLLLLDSECVGDSQPPKDSPYPTMLNVTYYHIQEGKLSINQYALVLLLLDSECVGDLQPPKDSPYPTMLDVTYYHINGGDLLPPPMPFI